MDPYPNSRHIPYAPRETAERYPEADGKPMAETDMHTGAIINLRLCITSSQRSLHTPHRRCAASTDSIRTTPNRRISLRGNWKHHAEPTRNNTHE